MLPYQMSIEALCHALDVIPSTGLSHKSIQEKQKQFGFNTIEDSTKRTIISIFISQFQNALIYILLIAATLIFFTSDKTIDAFLVTGILLFNAILGTMQEYRAQIIIESLKHYIKTETLVVRDGEKMVIPELNLVPGDIIFLHEGERIPADARILHCSVLSIDESILTGESEPVYKTTATIKEIMPLYLQQNMLFKGTIILAGSATAIVTNIGKSTEFGKLQKSISDIKTETPLKKSLEELSIIILFSIAILCLFLFLIGLWSGKSAHSLIAVLIALFICIIPEGLPLVLTLILVTGAKKLAKNNILVRNMQAVEALGHVNAIVIDKTGTITKNELMVSRIFADKTEYIVTGDGYKPIGSFFEKNIALSETPRSSDLYKTGIIASLMSDAQIIHDNKNSTDSIRGNQTEAALLVCAKKMKIPDAITASYQQLAEFPFQPDLQLHAALYNFDGKTETYIIGSPEAIFVRCGEIPQFFHESLQTLLRSGSRVVAIALKSEIANQSLEQSIKEGFQLLALFGIHDVIREDIKSVVEQARNAGIQVIMATGDHEITAKLIANAVGIFKKDDNNIDGALFSSMTDDDIEHSIEKTTLFSRMLPEHKMRIIKALHKKNKIVAMTGDGVNDAPALAYADVGIAMGSGTEVAKEAADIVLINDSFAYIIQAITFGKHIFYTLKRVLLYFFATNLSELCIIFFSFLLEVVLNLKMPLPITAAQILWLNLITDGFLDVGISMEKEESNLLTKKREGIHLLDKKIIGIGLYSAVFMAVVSLFFFYKNQHYGIHTAQTITLVTMAMFQWFNAWNCRSMERSIFSLGIFSNKLLMTTTVFVFVLQLGVIYLPSLQYLFDTTPISLHHWITITLVSSSIITCEEIRKQIQNTKKLSNNEI